MGRSPPRFLLRLEQPGSTLDVRGVEVQRKSTRMARGPCPVTGSDLVDRARRASLRVRFHDMQKRTPGLATPGTIQGHRVETRTWGLNGFGHCLEPSATEDVSPPLRFPLLQHMGRTAKGGHVMGGYDSVFRPGLFDGQSVLVTGGGTGLGRCTAHELASLGAQVVICGRREEVLGKTAEEIRSDGGRCEFEAMDLRDEESVIGAVSRAVERVGPIRGLFNNAGGQFAAPASKISTSAWQKVVDLNLNGTFRVTRALFEASMKEHGGSVVNMLADIRNGYVGMAHSAAARAGIENLSITLALEWARYDIRINCVAPGTILSSGMRTYPEAIQKSAVRGAGSVPAARIGSESEVAACVTFLLSPAAAFVTGQSLAIDGGSSYQKSVLFDVTQHAPTSRFDGFHRGEDWSGTPFSVFSEDQDDD